MTCSAQVVQLLRSVRSLLMHDISKLFGIRHYHQDVLVLQKDKTREEIRTREWLKSKRSKINRKYHKCCPGSSNHKRTVLKIHYCMALQILIITAAQDQTIIKKQHSRFTPVWHYRISSSLRPKITQSQKKQH